MSENDDGHATGDTRQIGVLGVGRMGSGILSRLSEAGFATSAFDPVVDATTNRTPGGTVWATSADDLAAAADVLVTVLPGPVEAARALEGPEGVLARLRPGSIWLDLTSNDPDVASRLVATAAEHGVASVAAPMGGGPGDARSGTLTLFVAGDPGPVGELEPILTVLTESGALKKVGVDPASAHTVKLALNALWFTNALAVTEAFLLVQNAGVSGDVFRDALRGSAGDSEFATRHLDALRRGDYLTTFGIDRVVDELDTIARLSHQGGLPAEVLTLVARLHRDALAEYGPELGELLGARLLEDRAGFTLKPPPR